MALLLHYGLITRMAKWSIHLFGDETIK